MKVETTENDFDFGLFEYFCVLKVIIAHFKTTIKTFPRKYFFFLKTQSWDHSAIRELGRMWIKCHQ